MNFVSILAITFYIITTAAISWWISGNLQRLLTKNRSVSTDQNWEKLAETLFEHHGRQSLPPEQKIHGLLEFTLERLQLRHAYLLLHAGEKSRVVAAVSRSYSVNPELLAGREIDRSRVYCGLLNQQRPLISIDAASLSEWRRHYACQGLGWESYIGAHVDLDESLCATLAFTDTLPRDRLFSSAEKQFLFGLAQWCSSLLRVEASAAKRGVKSNSTEVGTWNA